MSNSKNKVAAVYVTQIFVSLKDRRVGSAYLFSYTRTHNALAVYLVADDIAVAFKQVAIFICDH